MKTSIYKIEMEIEQNDRSPTAKQTIMASTKRVKTLRDALNAMRAGGLSVNPKSVETDHIVKQIASEIKYLRANIRERVKKTVVKCISRRLKDGYLAEVYCQGQPTYADALKTLRYKISQHRASRAAPYRELKSWKGARYSLVNGVFTEGLLEYIQKERARVAVWDTKRPKTNDNYVGVEIECFGYFSQDTVADAIVKAGLSHHVTVKGDGSIDAPSECGCENRDECSCDSSMTGVELSVMFKESETVDILTRVCRVLNGLEADVNGSCGLHVHIDARNRPPVETARRLVRAQELLYRMVPVSRSRNNFCARSKSASLSPKTRYRGVNTAAYGKFRTIEVRIHSGSVNADKIINWVKVLTKIADTPYTRLPSSLKGLKRVFGFDDTVLEYVKNRLLKFAKEHGSDRDGYIPFVQPKPKKAVETVPVDAVGQPIDGSATV